MKFYASILDAKGNYSYTACVFAMNAERAKRMFEIKYPGLKAVDIRTTADIG